LAAAGLLKSVSPVPPPGTARVFEADSIANNIPPVFAFERRERFPPPAALFYPENVRR
jgi:hypothetical protein